MDQNKPGRLSANLTDIEVAYILGAKDAGATQHQISALIGRSQSAVAKVTQKYNIKTFSGVTPPPGNVKKINKREHRTLLRTVRSNRRATLSDITNILPNKMSVSTLKRHLKDIGIQKHIAVKKPYLTAAHIQARLEFALRHKNWTLEDWLKVIWSDESKVEIGKNPRAVWVLRTSEEKYHTDCLTPVFKSGRSSIMVWGCFTGNRLGSLLAFEKGGISSREYIQTLKDGLLIFLQDLNGPEEPLDEDTIQVATPGQYTFQ
jgi:transposase